jgi:hypothetical protein
VTSSRAFVALQPRLASQSGVAHTHEIGDQRVGRNPDRIVGVALLTNRTVAREKD